MQPLTPTDVLCLLPIALLLLAFILNLYRKWHHLHATGEIEPPTDLEQNTPLDYAIYGVLWVYNQGASMMQKVSGQGRQRMPVHSGTMPADPLFAVLLDALHLLVIGPSRSGKTSLVHALAVQWIQQSRVIVCDPDAAPGLWQGCEVYGAGDDFVAIDQILTALTNVIRTRREQRAQGVRQFPPLRIILCEYADIARYCEQARAIIEDCLRRGGKLGIFLVLDVQDKQRKTLDLDGATHLLHNFSHVCEVRKSPNGLRTATVTTNDGEQAETNYDVPLLPDLDSLVRHEVVSSVSQLTGMVQPEQLRPDRVFSGIPVRDGTSSIQGSAIGNTSGTVLPDDDESSAIRYLLQHLGSKNKVAEFLGGSKTTAYKRINRALGEEE